MGIMHCARRGVALLACSTLLLTGCGDDEGGGSPGTGGSAASGGSGGSSTGGSGNSGGSDATGGSGNSGGSDATGGSSGAGGSDATGGSGGMSGSAGTGGGATSPSPKQAFGLPAAGVAAEGRLFKGVFTLGESPGGNGVMQSTNHQLRGGVVGATQQ